jgi:hypothetical protein
VTWSPATWLWESSTELDSSTQEPEMPALVERRGVLVLPVHGPEGESIWAVRAGRAGGAWRVRGTLYARVSTVVMPASIGRAMPER